MNELDKTAEVSKSAETPCYANVDDLGQAAKCVSLGDVFATFAPISFHIRFLPED